jgi:Uncharacterized protein conserved in bacteria
MRSSIKYSIFIIALLCSMKVCGQTDSENMIKQNIKEALLQNNGDRAQRSYNAWKEYANKTDTIVERIIKSCNNTPTFKSRVLIHWEMNTNPTFTDNNGGKYKGQTKDGVRNGLGAQYWASEDFYWGEWKGGNRSGYGIYTWPSGSVYVGHFSNSIRVGKGTYYDKTGTLIYYGEYKDNESIETFSLENYSAYKFSVSNYGDDIYMGETKDGKRHGKGIYMWADGDMWYGSWKEGSRDGYGILVKNDGTTRAGTWKENSYTP